MSRFQKILLGILAACALLAGFSLGTVLGPTQTPDAHTTVNAPAANPDELLGRDRPAFSLPDLNNQPRDIAEWDGQPLIVNFWATWCPPCREEIPAFMRTREKFADRHLEIIGIAIDRPDAVREYAAEMGINYPLLIGDIDASEVGRRYGNGHGGLPYTVFIDAAGKIRHIHARGALDEAGLETILAEILGNPVSASN